MLVSLHREWKFKLSSLLKEKWSALVLKIKLMHFTAALHLLANTLIFANWFYVHLL